VADAWEAGSTAAGIWEDYVWMAAVTFGSAGRRTSSASMCLWINICRWRLPRRRPANREEAEQHWRMAQAVMDLVAPATSEPRLDLLDELTEHSTVDIGWWLGEIPFALARFGMVDEAVELCVEWPPCVRWRTFSATSGDSGEAGRKEEALRQVEKNLARFPDDAWVRIKAGRRVSGTRRRGRRRGILSTRPERTPAAGSSYDRDGAVERLIASWMKRVGPKRLMPSSHRRKTRAAAWETGGDSSEGEGAEPSQDTGHTPSPEYAPSRRP